MSRIFIENDNAKIHLRDDFYLDLELYTGEKFEKLTPRRLFPVSGAEKYITLIKDRAEVAVIRNINNLMPESRKAVEKALNEHYFIPKIEEIIKANEKGGVLKITARTDRGICEFDVVDFYRSINVLFDRRVLIRDTNDNRYEIPDLDKIDYRSIANYIL